MNYLAIDTSGSYMCLVAKKGEKTYSSFLPDCTMKHSVLLMQKVEELLTLADMQISDFDCFAAVVGAGSFTGIRIGISAAKGFSLACNKPTLPITSFDTLAYNTLEQTGKVLCLIDALHDSYYACGYQGGEVVLPPCYLSEAEVLSLHGEGYELIAGEPLPIAQKAEVRVVSVEDGLKNALEKRASEGAFAPLQALYVRKSSAELNVCK